MPWKESSVMEERLRFVARLLDGEGMSDVCRDFGISRKTGYNIYNRYKEQGLDALCDRSRRPVLLKPINCPISLRAWSFSSNARSPIGVPARSGNF